MTCKILSQERWQRFLEDKLAPEESAEIMAHLDSECEDCQQFFAEMSPSMERRMVDLHRELHNRSEKPPVDAPFPIKDLDMVGATITAELPARGRGWLHSLFQFPSHATGWLGGAFAMLVVGIGIHQLYQTEPVIQHEKGIAPVVSTIGLDFAVGNRRQDGQLTVRRGTVGGEYPPNTMLFVRYDISSGGYVYLVGYRHGKTELLYPQGRTSGEFLPSGEHSVTYDGQVVGFPLEQMQGRYVIVGIYSPKPLNVSKQVIPLVARAVDDTAGTIDNRAIRPLGEAVAADAFYLNVGAR